MPVSMTKWISTGRAVASTPNARASATFETEGMNSAAHDLGTLFRQSRAKNENARRRGMHAHFARFGDIRDAEKICVICECAHRRADTVAVSVGLHDCEQLHTGTHAVRARRRRCGATRRDRSPPSSGGRWRQWGRESSGQGSERRWLAFRQFLVSAKRIALRVCLRSTESAQGSNVARFPAYRPMQKFLPLLIPFIALGAASAVPEEATPVPATGAPAMTETMLAQAAPKH
jgi:hypothetical protein